MGRRNRKFGCCGTSETNRQIIRFPFEYIFFWVQDQAIAIVAELCEANKTSVSPQIENICNLLLQVIEMALQLELCVLQICGIRPVLGRVEDFSKEIRTLFGGNISFLP